MPRPDRQPAIKRKRVPKNSGDEPSPPTRALRWFESGDYERVSINYDGDLRRDDRVVHIYGPVGQDYSDEGYPVYVTSLEVTKRVMELVQMERSPIYALVNCEGGSVWDMLGVLDAFDMARQNGCKVVTRLQGQAQSAGADIFVLGGDLRSMSKNSFIMTHGDLDKTLRFGDGLDLESEQRLRTIYQARLLDLYAEKTKLPHSYWKKQMMDSRPVYWSPKEALVAGLCDVIF